MMGIAPDVAARLTYWQFTAIRATWNKRHERDDPDAAVEPPSEDQVRESQAELARLGISGTKP